MYHFVFIPTLTPKTTRCVANFLKTCSGSHGHKSCGKFKCIGQDFLGLSILTQGKLCLHLYHIHVNKRWAPLLTIFYWRAAQNPNKAAKQVHLFIGGSGWVSRIESARPYCICTRCQDKTIRGRLLHIEGSQRKLEGLPGPLHWGPGGPTREPSEGAPGQLRRQQPCMD